MSTTLRVTIKEATGRIKLSRALFLGSEYDLTFVGTAEGEVPTIVMYDCNGDALVTSAAGELKLNTLELAALFEADDESPKTVHIYCYLDSVTLAHGVAVLYWSPLSFEYGDPVDIQGIKALWDSHIDDTANPHNVTAAQIGAAEDDHTHDVSTLTVNAPGGGEYRIKYEFVDGELTDYLEEQ